MAKSVQKKQKKQMQKKKKREAAKKAAATKLDAMAHAAFWQSRPVLECLVPEDLEDLGIGNVFFVRGTPGGGVGIGSFCVDMYCLGVKDAFFRVERHEDYELIIKAKMCGDAPLREVAPAYVRKLVESAVAYALDLGFSPHPDYRKAWPIFGDVDPAECTHEFTFGKDGKPLYIQGPNDSPQRAKLIMKTLSLKLGGENVHYLINDLSQLEDDPEIDAIWEREGLSDLMR